jgi:multisubunit Na+/H+ antiporter MnhE subunit
MGVYQLVLQGIMHQTLSVPWQDGVIAGLALFGWGWAISIGVRAANTFPSIHFVASLLVGAMVIRYMQSYVVYHRGLAEGVWPAAWTLALVLGVACARRNVSVAKVD